MKLLRQAHHGGVSFVPGSHRLHLWVDGSREELARRWRAFSERLVAGDLNVSSARGIVHAHASAFPLLPAALIQQVVEAAELDREAQGDLDQQPSAYRNYATSIGLYEAIALHRGWAVLPTRIAGMVALLLGIGRYARLQLNNLAQSASSIIALAANNKAIGRDLLQAHGIAVPPGGLAHSADRAVWLADQLGYPVAVKRTREGNSVAVILGITGPDACREAAAYLLEGCTYVLVEKMLPGIELRLHFTNGELAHVLEARPFEVEGDGRQDLRSLIERQHPAYARSMLSIAYYRRRTIMQLWSQGVRSIDDIARVVPARGARVRVSAASGAIMESRRREVIHRDDRRALERLLKQHGAPSAGVDVILSRPGARLAEGGGVLELNVPAGFAFVPGAARAVDRELLAIAESIPGFLRAGGRVPVWIAAREDFASRGSVRALEREFKRRFPKGCIAEMDEQAGWMAFLGESARAFLVMTTEDAVSCHGMPANLKPVLRHRAPKRELEECAPRLVATARNAGGRLQALPA